MRTGLLLPVAARAAALALLLAGCRTGGGELQSLAEQPPLDYVVLVSGGAFLEPGAFAEADSLLSSTYGGGDGREPFDVEGIVEMLRLGRVFQRVAADPDPEHRRALVAALRGQRAAGQEEVLDFLQRAREAGYDWLLLVEQLQDGPVEQRGINGQWPLTLSFWLLVGLGMFIPDHTFESRATLRVTVRDLQTGRNVHDPVLTGGPVDLSLVERSDFLGILISILVPPFWVHNDEDSVLAGVRDVSTRRLLFSLASDLKSQSTRLRLREGSVASISVSRRDGRLQLRIETEESLAVLRLRLENESLPVEVVEDCQRRLLESVSRDGSRFVYQAWLDYPTRDRLLQVLVRTIAGNVASITASTEQAQ